MKLLFWILVLTLLWLLLGVLGLIWCIKLENIKIEDIDYLKENTSIILFGEILIMFCLYVYLRKHFAKRWMIWWDKTNTEFCKWLIEKVNGKDGDKTD